MLIEITSEPFAYKNYEGEPDTMDATIDGRKGHLVQLHEDGSLWMSHLHAGEQGTALEYVPIPEDAMVIDLVHPNALASAAKQAKALAELGNNTENGIRDSLWEAAQKEPNFCYSRDLYRYIEREVNEIMQNEMLVNPQVTGKLQVDGVDVRVSGMKMSLKEVRNYVCTVKENQCDVDSELRTLDIAPAKEEELKDGISLDYSIGHPKFERIRRITGYLVGTVDRWNNAKRAEEHDRVKHGLAGAHR